MKSTLEGINTIFFDLDGTLLQFDEEMFLKIYTEGIYKYFTEYEPESFYNYFWKGTELMMRNEDPASTTLQVFLKSFSVDTNLTSEEVEQRFRSFYTDEFTKISGITRPYSARKVIDVCKNKKIKLVLATNPIFPRESTELRCQWAGIDINEFDYVSDARNSSFCKPNTRYYQNLLAQINSAPHEVLMVGNDCLLDMAASSIGIKTWLIDKGQLKIEDKGKFKINYEGSMTELITEIDNL